MYPVAILAGGLATRLRPLTETVPKSLIEIAGEPFLAHQLRLLKGKGINRVVLCLGYLGEKVREFAGDGARFGLEVAYSSDGAAPLGTAGALKRALPLLEDVFFVAYGDSYLPCDYQAIGDAFHKSGKQGLMTVFANGDRWDSSNVEFRDGCIVRYDKVVRTPAMRYIDYGLGVFHRRIFEELPDGFCDLASVYQDLLRRDELAAFEVPERFYEIGSVSGIEELSATLSPGGDKT
jgi:NDP-sugar pyrophosphorylase family protein